ncbi:MAG: Hsp20/alpha crystallin family protein [Terriglobales bacterium]
MSSRNARRSTGNPALTDPLDLFRDPTVLLRRIQEKTGNATLPVEVRPDMWVPAIEVTQSDSQLEILVELPGIEWMDVRVEVIGDRLVVQGERRHDVASDAIPRTVRRSERRYGHFYREIALPRGADIEHIQAKLNNGMLQITIPVSGEQFTGRRVPIAVTSASAEERG